MCLMADWTKIEQSPQSRMTEGLQRYVLRLSTGGCTADVGKYGISEKAACPKRLQPVIQRCNRIRPRLKSASCDCKVSICAPPTASCNSTPLAVKLSSTTNPPASATRNLTRASSANPQAQRSGTKDRADQPGAAALRVRICRAGPGQAAGGRGRWIGCG